MKKINYILQSFIICLMVVSCYEDNSQVGDKPIEEIRVENDAKDTINIYYNETLNISAKIGAGELPVTYNWGIGKYQEIEKEDAYGQKYKANVTVFETISNEKDLTFIVRDLGHYMIREMATNEHGSTMKYHHLFVNSPFEEGFLIFGRRPNGNGSIAFLKTLTPEEIELGMKPNFRQNVYEFVNGEEPHADPIDCDKIENKLYLLYGQPQKLTVIDAKTLEVNLEYDFKFYKADFIPNSLASYDGKYSRDLMVTSDNSGTAVVQLMEQAIYPMYDGFPTGYTFQKMYDRPSYFSSCFEAFVGKDKKGNDAVCFYGVGTDNSTFAYYPCYDYFKDSKVMHIFANEKDDGNDVSVISTKNGIVRITQVHSSITDRNKGGLWVLFERNLTNASIMTPDTKILVNDLYTCVFLGHKNKVYKWNYTQNDLPAEAYFELPEGEVVRCMNHFVVSRNEDEYRKLSVEAQTQIYVATYNPERATEFKGSLYIYDATTGEKIAAYEGISHEPVDMIYKNK